MPLEGAVADPKYRFLEAQHSVLAALWPARNRLKLPNIFASQRLLLKHIGCDWAKLLVGRKPNILRLCH
jgi:hypothetical protein